MLSHARTEMEVIKELADDASAYRSITQSWFDHSPLLEMMRKAYDMNARVIITTDHGTVRVEDPVKVIGDRNTNSNLRYKAGRNLDYKYKEVFEVRNPADAFLPKMNVSTQYIFSAGKDFSFTQTTTITSLIIIEILSSMGVFLWRKCSSHSSL